MGKKYPGTYSQIHLVTLWIIRRIIARSSSANNCLFRYPPLDPDPYLYERANYGLCMALLTDKRKITLCP